MSIVRVEDKLTDPEIGGRIIRYISEGYSEQVATGLAGVHPATYAGWLRRGYNDPEGVGPFGKFYLKVQWAKVLAEQQTTSKLLASEDAKVAQFILERRNPDAWGNRQRVEVDTGPSPEDIARMRKLPTEELEKMLAEGNMAALAEAKIIDVND